MDERPLFSLVVCSQLQKQHRTATAEEKTILLRLVRFVQWTDGKIVAGA